MSRAVILFVDQFAELGGAQRALLDLLPALEANYEPVFGLPGRGPFTEELERRRIRWELLALGEYRAGRKSPVDLLRYAVRQPFLAARVMELARQSRADLIYANGPRLFPATALAARRSGIPLLWHLHLELPSARDRRLLQAAARVGRAAIVACSRACLAAFPARSYFRRRAEVVYNGVPPVQLPRRHADRGPVIGLIGPVHPDKGQADLLRAAPNIAKAFPEARFRLVGPVSDEAYSRRLHESATRLGAGRVEFPGPAASPAAALAGLDLLVVASRRESFGRVILEAFSAGVPVVASDAGGIPEVVEHGRNGLLFARGNAGELARAAVRVLADVPLRRQLIRAARQSYRRRWGVERFAREMLERIERQILRRQQRRSSPAR